MAFLWLINGGDPITTYKVGADPPSSQPTPPNVHLPRNKASGLMKTHWFPLIRPAIKPSEPRKKPSYFPLYWFVNRDPYNGLL